MGKMILWQYCINSKMTGGEKNAPQFDNPNPRYACSGCVNKGRPCIGTVREYGQADRATVAAEQSPAAAFGNPSLPPTLDTIATSKISFESDNLLYALA
jgi:hypothetical protein